MIAPVFTSLRPRQWSKNLILFAALLFSEKSLLFKAEGWLYAFAGFVIFCGLSGAVYLLNDLTDIEKDRAHPVKCNRPIAAGEISVTEAKAVLIVLLIVCLFAAFRISELLFFTSLAYFMLNLAYSFKLKNVVILDVMCIATGFVLRAVAGVGALKPVESTIYISHWLILSTLMLAMFLGLVKRRQELSTLDDIAVKHRKILADYSSEYIDQMTSILACAAIITYSFYTVSPDTIRKFGHDHLILSVPMVLYGIMRYLYLVHICDLGDNPADVLLKDRPMQINLIIWVLVIFAVIHLPKIGWL